MNKNKQYTRSTKKAMPRFSSYEEEAKFWDTHDTTDYFDATPVGMRLSDDFKSEYRSANKPKGLTIRFPTSVVAQLRSRAVQKGIGVTTLARMWILERLQREQVQIIHDSD